MSKRLKKPSEIICYPDHMDFFGVTWSHEVGIDGMPVFKAVLKTGKHMQISQYPLDHTTHAGHWYWNADLGLQLSGAILQVLQKQLSGIESTMMNAVMHCLKAEELLLRDAGVLIAVLNPESEYSQGFQAGQELMKSKVMSFLKN